MKAIVGKLDIPPFPLDDEERLNQLAQGFRDKSCGQLFRNVIGAFDGYLLRVSTKCLSQEVNIKKYYCRCVRHVYVIVGVHTSSLYHCMFVVNNFTPLIAKCVAMHNAV